MQPRWADDHLIAHRDAAGEHGAGHHGAGPGQGEGAIDSEAERSLLLPVLLQTGSFDQAATKLSHAHFGDRRRRYDIKAFEPGAEKSVGNLVMRCGEPFGRHQVGLGQSDDAALYAK